MAASAARTGTDRWKAVGPFVAASKVEAIATSGGGSLLLVSSPDTAGGFWSEDGGKTWQCS